MQSLTNLSEAFVGDLASAHVIQSTSLIQRFLASLLTKRFVILTGLSGSGKTKLAQSLAVWMDGTSVGWPTGPIGIGDKVAADRATYSVDAVDSLSVQFSNLRDDGRTIKVVLPVALIYEWVQAIQDYGFDRQTTARTIRDRVAESTTYSTQLNSFETHLKAAAFHILGNTYIQSEPNSSASMVPRYTMVAVGADWHSSEPILGYPDALNPRRYVRTAVLDLILRAASEANVPHFLILDEMNLSHVERYFADVLSAIESGEPLHLYDSFNDSQLRDEVPPSIVLPHNLFIIGTVNVDETTYLFSPKVLDRANSIEFRVLQEDLERFLNATEPINLAALAGKGCHFAGEFLEASIGTPPHLDSQSGCFLNDEMKILFTLLGRHGLEFGYRTAYEMIRFVRQYAQIVPEWNMFDALDAQVYQKILPRLNGSRSSLEPVLSELLEHCQTVRAGTQQVMYPLSLQKIERMRHLLRQNGFTSFAEA